MTTILRRSLSLVALWLAATLTVLAQQPFDLVIAGGRVIDPESGLDGIRHIGLRGDRIAGISAAPLSGRDSIDATGLVVAPGFIDLHRHAVGNTSYQYAARDGVTSAFELEVGTADVEAWYRMLGPSRLINFGVGAGHIGARMEVLGDKGFLLPTGPGRLPATPEQVSQIVAIVERGLQAGGIAAGIGTSYTPGAGDAELSAVVEAASRHGAMVFAHLGSLKMAIAMAARFKTPLHVAHLNSTAGDRIREWLDTVAEARRQGLDVTTELYPYTASASLIQSALYDGWEKWPEERFATMQWAATGERLTRETFAKYRKQGGSVISHSNTEDNVRISVADPLPMIASDGGRDLEDRPTHPRASGTFARMLGEYVREQKLLTLQEALRRMTIEPARRLEARVPEMRDRGRLRVNAYADITVFDPETVKDGSTYVDAAEYSRGFRHVIVNGVPVVRDGEFVTHAVLQGQRVALGSSMPGRPIRAPRAER